MSYKLQLCIVIALEWINTYDEFYVNFLRENVEHGGKNSWKYTIHAI